MKTPLAARIESYLTDPQKPSSQKDLGNRLHDHHPEVKAATVIEKLSKLLNGHEDGEKFFFANAALEKALANEIGESLERLRFLRDIPILVLHPDMPLQTREYVNTRAKQCYGTFDWILPATIPEGAPRAAADAVKAIREKADEATRPVLVLVMAGMLSKPEERAFCEGAKLEVAVLTSKPRGYEVVGLPRILPLPSPEQPKLEDDQGRKLYGVAEMIVEATNAWKSLARDRLRGTTNEWDTFERAVGGGQSRNKSDSDLKQRLTRIFEREEVPTFYADEVIQWVRWQRHQEAPTAIFWTPPSFVDLTSSEVGLAWRVTEPTANNSFRAISLPGTEKQPVARAAPDKAWLAEELESCRFGRTTLWRHGEHWFVLGEHADKLEHALNELCPELVLRRPEFPIALAGLLKEHHTPWRPNPAWFVAFSAKAAEECGVQVAEVIKMWRHEALTQDAEHHGTYEFQGTDEAESARVRLRLDELLNMHFALSETQMWTVFVLRAVRDGQLLSVGRSTGSDDLNVVANLGTGNLVRLRVTHYPIEPAAPLRVMTEEDFRGITFSQPPKETHLDGGNVHIQIGVLPEVPLLEGSVARATRQRQVESGQRRS